MPSSSRRKITLRSSDGEDFEVDVAVASKSHMIKLLVEDGCDCNAIPLPNVTSKVLAKVIEYCKEHVEKEDREDQQLKNWDAQFVKVEKVHTLFDLILAANYLEIKGLADLTLQAAADWIKDYTPEQVRRLFGIKNDFSLEEEQKLREEHRWAHGP